MIEFDVETTSLQHHGADRGSVFLAQFMDAPLPIGEPKGPCLFPLPGSEADVQRWLNSDKFGYRAWNAKFDLHFLRQEGFALPPDHLWHDGMVQAHIMDERTSVSLEARSERLFPGEGKSERADAVKEWLKAETKRRRKVSKDEGEEFVEPNYGDVPDEIMHPYALGDVVQQRRVGDVYDDAIESHPDFKGLYQLERDVLRALFWIEDRGIPFDREALVAMESAMLPELDRAEDRCRELAEFENFNPRSPKQVSEALDRLEADVRFMTRSANGQLKTDEENLGACDHPLAETILGYRGEHKLYAMLRGILHTGSNDSKFPYAYLTAEDRVHPNFRQVGARTGRMSCSNPNFQQVNRDDLRLRYAVAAGPGKKLVTCDLDSIELRLLAAFAGEGAMRSAIQAGRDSHSQTADFVGLTGRRRSTGVMESPRDQGKKLNYLIVYGGGVTAIRKWFGVSQKEARSILSRMHQAYPEIASLQNSIDFALEGRGYVKSPLTGRRWRMYGTGPTAVEREGYKFINYLIQGTAADVIKIAVARCHERGVPMIGVVHDEILAEPDAADAEECARVIEDCMTSGFEEITERAKVPILAEAQVVDRWSQAKKPDYVPEYAQ